MTNDNFFTSVSWNSVTGMDGALNDGKIITAMKNTTANRAFFVEAGDGLLVHKTTKALWRQSDDGKMIVPVFESDVLTAEDLKKLEEE